MILLDVFYWGELKYVKESMKWMGHRVCAEVTSECECMRLRDGVTVLLFGWTAHFLRERKERVKEFWNELERFLMQYETAQREVVRKGWGACSAVV